MGAPVFVWSYLEVLFYWFGTIVGFLAMLCVGGFALIVWALALLAVVRRWRTASYTRKVISSLGLFAGLFAVNGPFFTALKHYVVKGSAVRPGAGLAADGNYYLSGLPGRPDQIEVPRDTYVTLYWYEIVSLCVPWFGGAVFAASLLGFGAYYLIRRQRRSIRE